MGNVQKLLDAAKEKTGAKNDLQLSKVLDIHSARISDYYKKRCIPDEYACLKLAELLEIPLDVIIASVRSESEKDETRREAWKRYAKSLGGLAAGFMIIALSAMTFVTLFVTSDAQAQERQGLQTGQSHPIQIMRFPGSLNAVAQNIANRTLSLKNPAFNTAISLAKH